MTGSFRVRLFEFRCFSVRLEAEIGEFSVPFPPSRAASSWDYRCFSGALHQCCAGFRMLGFLERLGLRVVVLQQRKVFRGLIGTGESGLGLPFLWNCSTRCCHQTEIGSFTGQFY